MPDMYPWFAELNQQLCQRSHQGTLHHALLLSGMAGLGKKQWADQLAGFLLCSQKHLNQACGQCQSCTLKKADSHPDFYLVESEKQIGVDQIRDGIARLLGTAQLSGAKVLVIHAAESMTEAAANALLKTLEEPTPNTYLILVTDSAERLLPTILSRCEKHLMHPPEPSVCKSWLQQEGLGQVDEALLKLYGYAPLRLLQELGEDEGLTFTLFSEQICQLRSGALSSVDMAEQWAEEAGKMIRFLQFDILRECQQRPADQDPWQSVFAKTQQASIGLNRPGINKMLLLAGLLDTYSVLNLE